MHHKSQASSATLQTILHGQTCQWLKGRGKAVAPRLSEAQQQELHDCFKLMDLDGSGSIGLSELKAAFKLLGIKMTHKQVEAVLHQADSSGDGELDYTEFLQIMTNTLKKLTSDKPTSSHATKLPFGLIATAYRRKRYLENILENDKEAVSQMVSMALTGDRPWQVGTGNEDYEPKSSCNNIAARDPNKVTCQVTTAKRLGALLAYPDLNMISQLDGFQQQLLVQEARRVLGVCQPCSSTTQPTAAGTLNDVHSSSNPVSPRYHSHAAQIAAGHRPHENTNPSCHNRSTPSSPRPWQSSPSTTFPACNTRPASARYRPSSPYATPRAKQSSPSPYAKQSAAAAYTGKRPVGSLLASPVSPRPQASHAAWGCGNITTSKALDAILTPRAKPCYTHHVSHQQLMDSPRVRATLIFCGTNVASLPRTARPTSGAAALAARASREHYYQQQRNEANTLQDDEAEYEDTRTLQPLCSQPNTAFTQQERPVLGVNAATSVQAPARPVVPPLALNKLTEAYHDGQQGSSQGVGAAEGHLSNGHCSQQDCGTSSCLSYRGQSLLPYASSPRGFAGYMRNAREHAQHVVQSTYKSQHKQGSGTQC